ncbi:MAG: hypothetical protein M1834_003010 [Cirrosporium novae-zelandiae]|nr:MAG: hypothetical protein M1834_003010 [Cirrosporium novae-zelandiae]
MALESLNNKLESLQAYTACDISDALLKLQKVPNGERPLAGFMADIDVRSLQAVPFAPNPPSSTALADQPKVIAPISTVQFISKQPTLAESLIDTLPASNIPSGTHWADLMKVNTVVILSQPAGQKCAVLGGIMATRLKVIGVKGIIAAEGGRVRDLRELRGLGLPIWARARSTVGAGAESKVHSIDVPIIVGGLSVNPGDIAFCDPLEGCVIIPQDLVDGVLAILPKLVEADDKVKEDVLNGKTVFESFAKHR